MNGITYPKFIGKERRGHPAIKAKKTSRRPDPREEKGEITEPPRP